MAEVLDAHLSRGQVIGSGMRFTLAIPALNLSVCAKAPAAPLCRLIMAQAPQHAQSSLRVFTADGTLAYTVRSAAELAELDISEGQFKFSIRKWKPRDFGFFHTEDDDEPQTDAEA